jgi:hypothetical protein
MITAAETEARRAGVKVIKETQRLASPLKMK